MKATLPELSLVKDRLSYDPETGVFTWLKGFGRCRAGDKAGYLDTHGYITIRINRVLYYAHRLAYYLMTEKDPGDLQVDHINLNRSDTRWVNLRASTQCQNMWNTKSPSTNTSGVKGVYWHKQNNHWRAEIKVNKKKIDLGGFPTIEKAEQALKERREQLHKEFHNHG